MIILLKKIKKVKYVKILVLNVTDFLGSYVK